MIKHFFPLQLALAFLAGTLWNFFSVAFGLKFSSKLAVFMGGLPSTAFLSLFFIGLTQTPDVVATVTTIFPLSIAISGIFMVVFAMTVRQGFMAAFVSALLSGVILSLIVIMFTLRRFSFNMMILFVVFIVVYVMLEYLLKVRSVHVEKSRYPEKHVVMRSLFGGLAVMMTLVIEKRGGAEWAGVFAAFPAMSIAMLALTYRAHGAEFARWMTKSLMLTSMITMAVYAIVFKILYIRAGLWVGTFLALSLSAISVYLIYRFIMPKLK